MKGQLQYIVFSLTILGLFCNIAFAQSDLDSIITVSTIKIYDNPNAAIEIGTSTFEKATNPQTKIKALMLISNAYLSKRENEKSLEYALKARDYLPEIVSTISKINVLNTIGMQHQQLRIYDKAIEYLDEALALADKTTQKDSINTLLAYNYAIRGFIYREQMSCDIALNYFDKSMEAYKKGLGETRYANLSTLSYNKGNCLLQISQIDSARANFQRAIGYAERVDAKSLLAFAKKGLSEVFTVEGNYKQAIAILNEAEVASEDVGDLILNQGIYKNLSDNYLALNNRESYKLYFEKFTNVQQEIAQKEQITINNSISNLMEEFQLKTEDEISNLRRVQWILMFFSIIVLFFLGRLVFKNHKKYLKIKQKLETFRQ
ncbi:MAG TPA: tetratricopeptide repeat protein [Aequorivita sp.]|nr:tetratricopeptide repeat protein [Aequorivita sp.]